MTPFQWYALTFGLFGAWFLFRATAAHGVVIAFWLVAAIPAYFLFKPRLRSPFWWVFLPVFALYVCNGKMMVLSSYDNYGINLATRSLVSGEWLEVSQRLKEDQEKSGDPSTPYSVRRTARGLYSAYPLGNLWFSLPIFSLAALLHADFPFQQWRLAKLAASTATALAVLFLFLALRACTSSQTAAWVTALAAFASPLFTVTSQGLWTHTGVVFWQSVVLFLAARRPAREPWNSILEGFCLVQALPCRLTSLAFVLPFSIFKLTQKKWLAFFLLGGVLGFLPWALLYHHLYGAYLGPQIGMTEHIRISLPSVWQTATDRLFSPSKGLMVYVPWVWLLLLYAYRPVRAFVDKPLFSVCAIATACCFVGLTLWNDGLAGIGGWCYGPRLYADILPALAFTLAPVVEWIRTSLQPATARRALALVLALGLFFHVGAAFCPPRRNASWFDVARSDWSWSEAPFLEPYFGHLAAQNPEKK